MHSTKVHAMWVRTALLDSERFADQSERGSNSDTIAGISSETT
jgi:hypothetical protein